MTCLLVLFRSCCLHMVARSRGETGLDPTCGDEVTFGLSAELATSHRGFHGAVSKLDRLTTGHHQKMDSALG